MKNGDIFVKPALGQVWIFTDCRALDLYPEGYAFLIDYTQEPINDCASYSVNGLIIAAGLENETYMVGGYKLSNSECLLHSKEYRFSPELTKAFGSYDVDAIFETEFPDPYASIQIDVNTGITVAEKPSHKTVEVYTRHQIEVMLAKANSAGGGE